jgi:predicted nucleic acid-binding protein
LGLSITEAAAALGVPRTTLSQLVNEKRGISPEMAVRLSKSWMSGFLIDTNVLSEYNRLGGPDAGVKRWLEITDRRSQHVSVITLAEIQKGIELLAEGKRRAQLEQWLTQDLEAWFSSRVLLMDKDFEGTGVTTINPWEISTEPQDWSRD